MRIKPMRKSATTSLGISGGDFALSGVPCIVFHSVETRSRVIWSNPCLDHGNTLIVLKNSADQMLCRAREYTKANENPDAVMVNGPQDGFPECR